MSPFRMAALTLATAVALGHLTPMRAGQSSKSDTTQLCSGRWVSMAAGHTDESAVHGKQGYQLVACSSQPSKQEAAASRAPHVGQEDVSLLAAALPQLLCNRCCPRQVLVEVMAEHRIVIARHARLVRVEALG